jgi:hypothetical protein
MTTPNDDSDKQNQADEPKLPPDNSSLEFGTGFRNREPDEHKQIKREK